MIQFDGFSDREKIFAMEAFRRMKMASSSAKTALLGADLTAYRKWFEASDATQTMKVATIVNEVDAAISGRPITFAKVDRPGVNAETSGLCGYVFRCAPAASCTTWEAACGSWLCGARTPPPNSPT